MAKFQEFLVGPVTLSFVDGLWTKQQMRGSDREPQYVVNAILDDPAAAQLFNQWVDYAISQGHPGTPREHFTEDHFALKDCAKQKSYSKAFPAGTQWFRAKSNFQPTVLDVDRQTAVSVNGPDSNNPGKNIFHAGTKAYLVVHLYTYTYNNRPGVQVGLNQVIKVGNGTPFEERSGGDYSELLQSMPGQPGRASSAPPGAGGPPAAPGGYGAPSAAPGGYGAPQSGPPAAPGGYGAPPAAPGGYGAPQGGPPAAPGGYGAPSAAPGGYGAPQGGPPAFNPGSAPPPPSGAYAPPGAPTGGYSDDIPF